MRYPKRQVVCQPFISQLDAIEKTLIEVQNQSVLVYGQELTASLRMSVSGDGKYVERKSLRKSSGGDQYGERKSHRKSSRGGNHSSKYGKNDTLTNSGLRFEKDSSDRSNISCNYTDMACSDSFSPSPNIFGSPTTNIPLSLFDPFKPMEFASDKSKFFNSPYEMEFGLEPQLELIGVRRVNSLDQSFSKNIWSNSSKKSPVWG